LLEMSTLHDSCCWRRAVATPDPGCPYSGDDFPHHARRFHPGEPLVEALITERKPLVVHAQQVKHCGVEIVDVNGVFDDIVAKLVRLAVNRSRPRTAACHPHREAPWMMVPAIIVLGETALR